MIVKSIRIHEKFMQNQLGIKEINVISIANQLKIKENQIKNNDKPKNQFEVNKNSLEIKGNQLTIRKNK